jgi:hypothetical protein
MDGIIGLMIYLAVIWLVAWLITTLIPIPAQGKMIIYAVAGIFSLLIILRAFGLSDGNMDVPRIDTH